LATLRLGVVGRGGFHLDRVVTEAQLRERETADRRQVVDPFCHAEMPFRAQEHQAAAKEVVLHSQPLSKFKFGFKI